MSINRRILKETPFPREASRELVEFYADTIRPHPGHDLENPEWPRAPIVPLDLSERGGGIVSVMNEADVTINPSGTFKERAVHEVKMAYGQLMRSLLMNRLDGPVV
ncbi:hypothetical protein GOV07_04030, partial [Candidatus Woesearchaeota archaeon]|nr:hypothetical protein [Candidatus Woesearchaeota archaeon]